MVHEDDGDANAKEMFVGSVAGMIFTTREGVTGYFVDSCASVAAAAGVRHTNRFERRAGRTFPVLAESAMVERSWHTPHQIPGAARRGHGDDGKGLSAD